MPDDSNLFPHNAMAEWGRMAHWWLTLYNIGLKVARKYSPMTMEAIYFDEPPSYAGSSLSCSSTPSPSYSPTPRQSEVLIRTSSQSYVYRSKHITVNLGLKIWGTANPVYGGGTSVQGTFSLSEKLKNVSSVCVKLEGTVTNSYMERGLVTGASSVDIVSVSSTFPAPLSEEFTAERPFSLLIPTYTNGKRSLVPPSSILYHPGVTCVIRYRLKISVVRRGFHMNETLKIPILYLPRTFAKGPSMLRLPEIPSDPSGQEFTAGRNECKILQLQPSGKSVSLEDAPIVTLVLPPILSFAAYETIPLKLNVITQRNAAIAQLLLSGAKIQLIKRTRTWINGGRMSSKHEMVVGVAQVIGTNESEEGMFTTSYELRTTRRSVQGSWAVEGVVEQQCCVRVTVRPPASIAGYVPKYDCEQLIELTTDAYESIEREIALTGGLSSPAIGTLAETYTQMTRWTVRGPGFQEE